MADGIAEGQRRAWLKPYILLMHCWRAFSDLPPSKELRALLERVFAGRGLCLYARFNNNLPVGRRSRIVS
jgi:hypothetical protein